MEAIKYKVKLINPIIISKNGDDENMLNTKTYIKGNSILGLFAKKYIEKNNLKDKAHKDKTFYDWFLDGNLIFTNAYITENDKKYLTSPLSIQKVKYKDEYYELLFVTEEFDIPTKPFPKYISISNNILTTCSVQKKLSFHHERDRKTGTSKLGKIFNYESLRPGQEFTGSIIGEKESIEKLIQISGNTFTGFIGRSKNTEYGKVEISLGGIKEYYNDLGTESKSEDEKVIMTLLSDTILYNEKGFSVVNVSDLENNIGVKILKSFIKIERDEKFVGIWNCKNQSENCFSAGSSFLLENLPDKYEDIQISGIGERTNEGFGRVVFEYQATGEDEENKEYIISYNEEDLKKPSFSIPEKAKEIVLKIIIEKIRSSTIANAMENAKRFDKIPSNSLLGKLTLLSKDINKFNSHYNEVIKRKTAQDALSKCRNNKERLVEYLNKPEFVNVNDYGSEPINSLLTSLNMKLKEIICADFKKELNRIYLETFLKSLKWKNKKEGGK